MHSATHVLANKAREMDPENLPADVMREFKRITGEVTQFASGTKESLAAQNARLLEVEQQLARRSNSPGTYESDENPCTALAASPQLRSLLEQPGKIKLQTRSSIRHLAKAITSATVDNSTGFPVAPAQLPGIYGMPARSLRLLEVLPSVPFATNSLEYPSLTDDFSNAADYQLTEAAQKAETSPEFDLQTTPIVTIAHWVQASKQILEDVPVLQAWLERLLRYGVLTKVERELVLGTGVGKRLKGLLTAATPAVVAATHPVDAIGEAAVALEVAGWQPSLTILHPADAFAIVSERTTTGEYVAGGWASPNQSSFWNLQRVTTPSVPVGTAIVMDPSAVLILDREQPTVLVSNQDRDNFIKNLVTLLGEIRLGMAILNPQAIVSVPLPSLSP
jgi:HK97 family phage major capsid protein